MTKQIVALRVTLMNPSESREFRGHSDSKFIEGVLAITEADRLTVFPIHRIVETLSWKEDSE